MLSKRLLFTMHLVLLIAIFNGASLVHGRAPFPLDSVLKLRGDAFELKEVIPKSDSCDCGTPIQNSVGSRIVGGTEAAVNSEPWLALLYIGNYVCTGTLIDPQWVLTASHCLYGQENSEVEILLGAHYQDEEIAGELALTPLARFMHEQYDHQNVENDVALLKLEFPVTCTATIKPACLPSADLSLSTGTDVLVAGWGLLSSNPEQPSNTLQIATVAVSDFDDCDTVYSIYSSNFCAIAPGKDTCTGDSGGPAFYDKESGGQLKRYIYGVTSYGSQEGCATPNNPGVYAEVPYYIDWINGKMSQ